MSEQAAEHSQLSFGIHENNAFSGTGAIPLKILLSSLFMADLKSEKCMTGQSHMRAFNHVVMKGNLAHDELLRGLKQEAARHEHGVCSLQQVLQDPTENT